MPRTGEPDIPRLSESEDLALREQIANDPDACELDDAQLAQMRPAREVLPKPLYAALTLSPGSTIPVTIHVERAVVDAFRATGEDWEDRMSAVLSREAERIADAE